MLGGVCSASDWAHSYITGQAHASRCLFPFAVSPADAKTLRLVHAWLWLVPVLSCWLLRRSTRWRTQRRCSTSQTDPSSRSQQPRSSRQRRAQQAGQQAGQRVAVVKGSGLLESFTHTRVANSTTTSASKIQDRPNSRAPAADESARRGKAAKSSPARARSVRRLHALPKYWLNLNSSAGASFQYRFI
jgi:hypothetical protein